MGADRKGQDVSFRQGGRSQVEETALLFEKEETEEKARICENPESVTDKTEPGESAILTDLKENSQNSQEKPQKHISKIIIFYDDNSFVEIR